MRARAVAAVLAAVITSGAAILSEPVSYAADSAPSVRAYGTATAWGSPDPALLHSPLAGVESTPDGHGYWLVSTGGGVFTYGDAPFYGSAGGSGSWGAYVGMASTAIGHGYWEALDTGLVSNYGDAGGAVLDVEPSAPIVGITADPGTAGFWLVGADGGVFSLDGARFFGSLGGIRLNAAIVGMAATPDGRGYWLVAGDGGVFSFGDARFFGSTGGLRLNAPVVGMAATPDGGGYWLAAADGGMFTFGDAGFHGSAGTDPAPSSTPVVGMAATPDGAGYWMVTTDESLSATGSLPRVVAQCNQAGRDPQIRPAQIVLACGDGNAWLDHLVWSSWTPRGASGVGRFVHNTCNPDCAQGTFVSSSATVKLAYPVRTGEGREFAGLTYTYRDPSAPSGHRTYSEVAPTSPG